jgi:pyrroline-5-carboxylate reductase
MRIGFVGSGSMAAAMARGWSGAEGFDGSLLFTDGGSGRAAELATELGAETAADNAALAAGADLVVLAVKPAHLAEVAGELISAGKPVLSLLGATSLGALGEALPGLPIARVMPNVAVEVRRGVLCYAPAEGLGADRDRELRELLAILGNVISVADDKIDVATAVMGCSPAYVALLCETLTAAAVERGLPAEEAHFMVAEAIAGTGELLAVGADAAGLREAVASPGGSTEAGLEALERARFTDALHRGVEASLEKMGR